jgi:hypothetical protein
MIVAMIAARAMETGVVAVGSVVAGGEEEEVGIEEGKVAMVIAMMIAKYVFLLPRPTFALITHFSSEALLRDVHQDTIRDQDHPLDVIAPDLILQDHGVGLLLIPRGHPRRTDAATDLPRLGAVGRIIAQGHALGRHTVMVVGEGVLHLVGEGCRRLRQDPPEVSTPASDAAAMLPQFTLPALAHPRNDLLSKIAVGLGQRPGPRPGPGRAPNRALGYPGRCAVPPHRRASVSVAVRAPRLPLRAIARRGAAPGSVPEQYPSVPQGRIQDAAYENGGG